MRYVALLRGINVGGNNKVSMAQLKDALAADGLDDVSTYINSGNIFFSSDHPPAKVERMVHDAISREFGLDIKVLIKDLPAIRSIAAEIPDEWRNDADMKCDVMYLWDSHAAPDVVDSLPVREGIDEVRYTAGAIIWKVDKALVTRSGLGKLVGTDLYAHMTVRNANTARVLLQRLEMP